MRDLLLLAALFGVAPLILRSPFVGVLTWLWVALMNPHQEVSGFLQGAQLNLVIAALTVVAWLTSKERKTLPPNPFVAALLVFAGWICVTTYFALDRVHAAPLLDRTLKSIVLALAVIMLANSRARLQAVIWGLVISIGYYGAKGGGFVLLTGGRHHVFGPAHSMIEDNNALGLALVVLLPLMFYLRLTSARPLVRWGLLGLIGLTLIAILGTYSRGALVALAASVVVYAVRSRYGVALLLAGAIAAAALPAVMPGKWLDRMATIQSASEDASFQDRISAWRTSFNIAQARPLIGGGFSAVEANAVAETYRSPGSLAHGRAAHSIYFQVLGDTGFLGLVLYLALVAAAGFNTLWVLYMVRGRADLRWAGPLARMLQVSLVGFLAGGAALSMAYYDGVMMLFALTAALAETVRRPATVAAASSEPRWKQVTRPALAAAAPGRAADRPPDRPLRVRA